MTCYGCLTLERKWSVFALRFKQVEVAEDELKGDPDGVYDVVLPLERTKCDRVGILVEHQRSVDTKIHYHEALGTNAEWQAV